MRNKKLVERYPWLTPRSVWNDKLPKDYDYTYTEADCFPKGWRKAFFKEMHEEIRDELIRCNYLNEFRVLQIKEKYGRCCYYFGGIPHDCNVDDIVRKYEFLSEYICIECGKLGVHNIPVNGWYSPICEKCYDKHIARLNRWYDNHGFPPYKYPTYEDVLSKLDIDSKADIECTLPTVIRNKVRRPGQDWETIETDISDTVEKLRRKERNVNWNL